MLFERIGGTSTRQQCNRILARGHWVTWKIVNAVFEAQQINNIATGHLFFEIVEIAGLETEPRDHNPNRDACPRKLQSITVECIFTFLFFY